MDRRGACDFVTRALRRLNYSGLSKAHKGVVRRFVAKVTGWSRAQTTRLIGPAVPALISVTPHG